MESTTNDGRERSRIKRKLARGTELTSDEAAFMAAWKPGKRGRKPKGERSETRADVGAAAPELADEPVPEAAPDVAPEFELPDESMPPATEAPRVGPRDAGKRAGKAGKSDWRAKYREGSADTEREATCLQAAGLWIGAILKLNGSVAAAGKTPVIPSAMIASVTNGGLALGPIGKAAVLLADRLIPADVAIGPEPLVIGATTVVAFQAWWVTRKPGGKKPGPGPVRDAYVTARPDPAPEPSPSTSNGTAAHAAPSQVPLVALVRSAPADAGPVY